MLRRNLLPALLVIVTLFLPVQLVAAEDATSTEARLLRFPDIHRDFVVFVYGGDLWRVASSGGAARQLTSFDGQELFPKISHDGEWIAFTAEHSGSRQVWVMPAAGGSARQLTYYTDVGAMPPRGGWDNWIMGWSADGKILVRMNRTPFGRRVGRYFLVDPAGGLETPLPLLEGGSASLSADGKRLAYTPKSREFRTWKRTRGGRAQDIWIYDLEANRSERLTTDRGTDNFPMWTGEKIYFTSDRGDTLNLFSFDLGSRAIEQATGFDTWDVLWPSLGPESIVFMNGGYLHRFDLSSGESRQLEIHIQSALPHTVPRFVDLSDNLDNTSISPSGARVAMTARGELFTVPAEKGPTRRLLRTPDHRERGVAWSPDGRWLAYFSDRSGEYEIHLLAQDGSGEPRQLTDGLAAWPNGLLWSPDSKHLAVSDSDRWLRTVEVESGEVTDVARGRVGNIGSYDWSPDSRWLAYEQEHPESELGGLALYSLDSGESTQLGDGLTVDREPVWSSDGKHLFFFSNRDYNLTFSSFEFNYLYNNATRVYAAALDPQADPLFPRESDEEKPAEEETDEAEPEAKKSSKGKQGKKDQGADKPAKDPLRIEPDGFVARTIALPGVESGGYGGLLASEGALYFVAFGNNGPPELKRYDLSGKKLESVVQGISGYSLSADGKKLAYRARGKVFVVGAQAGVKAGDGELDLSALKVKLDPHREWAQLYRDGWRVVRDFFYDRNMHGFDWQAIGDRYGELVPHVAHRGELDFIFGELIGELEAGHTYVQSGDEPGVDRLPGALLGAELEANDSGHYRIAHIYQGENWDSRYRSPLTEPGVDAKVGDFVMAIDGEPLDTDENPYRLLEGKADQLVRLTLSASGSLDDARQVDIQPIEFEGDLRYLQWVRERMALTDRLSGGRVGYIHLPNTAGDGNRMLQKLFYGQVRKEALIIDDRYNGGGFIPDRMIEYLSRRTMSAWSRRDDSGFRTPGFAHDGPKAMLINGYSSSGGDALPFFFRQEGLGKLIGTRTWGGLIGISGAPSLADGGTVLPPTFRIYDRNGEWVVENEGVSPDIEVIDLPERLIEGGDPSLEKGVEVLLQELEQGSFGDPPTPTPPDMSR
nr:tricorn protease homolog 1-like [Nerophis lumbriciformis]